VPLSRVQLHPHNFLASIFVGRSEHVACALCSQVSWLAVKSCVPPRYHAALCMLTTCPHTDSPSQLHYLKLPKSMPPTSSVLVLDATVASGAAGAAVPYIKSRWHRSLSSASNLDCRPSVMPCVMVLAGPPQFGHVLANLILICRCGRGPLQL